MDRLMDKYVMSKAQYDALDKALTKSHLCDIYTIVQEDNCDFILDTENDIKMSLKEGLEEVDEYFSDFINCYGFTNADIMAYNLLLNQFGITNNCETR